MTVSDARLPTMIWLVCCLTAIQAQGPSGRSAVPDAAAQAKAQQLVRDVYGKEFEATKTSAEKTGLAKKLLDQAAKSKGDPAGHFVLLRIAKEVAVLAGDAQTAMEAVERTVRTYEVDAVEMKLECLQGVSRAAKSSTQRAALAKQAFSLLEAAVAEDNFQAAVEMGELARESALKAREFSLAKRILARLKEIENRKAAYGEYEKAMGRLGESPTDPEANLAAGRYVCLTKGDWDRGIPMLALGSDPALKALAVKELKGAASAEAQAALGDGWWDLAQTKEGRERESFLLRAGHWYQQAQADVTSALMKAKLQKRLEEISEIEQAAAQLAAPRPPGAKTVKPFDPATAELLATLRGHTGAVRSVAFSPDGKTLVSGSMDHTVRLWNVAKRERRGVLPPFKHGELDVALSPDGSLLAVAGREFTASVWSAASGQFRGLLTGHTKGVFCIAFSPDGSLLATGSDDNTVILWHVATARPRGRIVGHGNKVYAVAFSPDGSLLASGAHDQPVRLWDVATGTLRRALPGSETAVFCVAFSPNGSIVASGGSRKTVQLSSAATGELLRTLQGHESVVNGVAFSPDGSLLASGSHDKTAKLWDVTSGALRRTLEGHLGYVWSVAFSPDGSLLASASEDSTIKLWGTPTTPASPADRTRKPSDDRVVTRRIDFRRPDAIRQFVLSKPENVAWNAKEKAMVIGSDKRGMAMVTYGEHFRSISSVTVRGKIVPPSQHCLRIGVGPLSLLFNWSGGNQNRFHVWQGVTATQPHALTPGTMHEIQIAQQDELVVITLDGNQHHTTAVRLDGTVSVYTGYGNTIAVSEIVIEGVPQPGVRVTGPSHRLY